MKVKNIQNKWNNYVHTLHTYTTYTTLHTLLTPNTLADDERENVEDSYVFSEDELAFFDALKASELDGRNLELYFPLLVVARMISDTLFKEILDIASKRINESKKDALNLDEDVALIEFVAMQPENLDYTDISKLVGDFREFYLQGGENPDWLNTTWMGKALRRLFLIRKSRRVGRGSQVMLNVSHAIEKLKIHREVEDNEK